jgi:hypothetical protein
MDCLEALSLVLYCEPPHLRRRIASGHLDLDPAWLRMLRLGDAQGEYTMFDLGGNLGGQ